MTNDLRRRAERRLHACGAEVASMPIEDVRALVHELQIHQVELEMQNEELLRTQLDLADARDRYADLYEFAPVGYVLLDRRQVIVESNLTWAQMLQVNRSELIGSKFTQWVAHEFQDDCHQCVRAALAGGQDMSSELAFCRGGGGLFWGMVRLIPGRSSADNTRKLRCAISDITERKSLETMLCKSQERLELALEAGTIGTWDIDVAQEKVTWNRQLYELLGYPAPVAISPESFFGHIHPEDLDRVRAHFDQTLQQGTEFRDEFRIVRADGACRWFVSRGRLTRAVDGSPERMIGVNFDVTARKDAELHLQYVIQQQTAELRLLGARLVDAHEQERQRIAVDLHDEVGQLVAASQLAVTRAEQTADVPARHSLVQQAVRLLDDVSNKIRDLSFELSAGALFDAGFLPAIEELCERKAVEWGMEMRVECSQRDPQVPAELHSLLYRCVRELLSNAAKHAQSDRAIVRLEAAADRLPAGAPDIPPAQRVLRILVQDQGRGFDPAMLNQVLGPTSGFGIRSMRQQLEAVGGRLSFKAVPGHGVTAIVEVGCPR